MKDWFQRSLNLFLSLTIFMSMPVGAAQVNQDASPQDDLNADVQRLYWGQLDQQNPLLTEFALGEPITEKPLYVVTGNNPLLDSNPFFMRTQKWVEAPSQKCTETYCFSKEADGSLTLQLGEEAKALQLNEKFTPVLETRDYVILTADDIQIFQAKNPADADPGQGFFFIAKRDLNKSLAYQFAVPVYFFPTPGEGWTGPNEHAFEMGTTDQVVLYNHDGFGLPIDRSDIALLEKVERNNLNLAQTWTILENPQAGGLPLPKANATLAFGLFLSGQMPKATQDVGRLDSRKIFSEVAGLILPQASAHEADPTMHQLLTDDLTARAEQMKEIAPPTVEQEKRSWLRRWATPLIAYGATAAAAIGIGPHIDWSQLITADMPQRIATVSEMLGGVLVASVAMKYSIHKAIFDKKYPKTPDETWIQRLNKEHKGILDELVHGLWFSMAFLPQGIRHSLDFLKDRFFPNNRMINKAWEATMGFAMKQSSRLAMNWKTFYLGSIVFGMSDAMMVAVHLLIFTPFLAQHFGWQGALGGATAAFASSEVLRNFLAYLQGGAHSYSSDVKMIHLKSAQNEAKRMVQGLGLDPEAAKNEGMVSRYTELQMEKRFKMVGLPDESQFLYDPITVLEDVMARAGFSTEDQDKMSKEDKELLAGTDFVLSRRKWGLIKPALQKAYATAQDAYAIAPSDTGLQTVKLLEWALNNRSLAKAVAGQAYDTLASGWGLDGINQAMAAEIEAARGGDGKVMSLLPNWLQVITAASKGAIKYLALDSTKEVRDIRQTLFLMSTSGSPLDVMKFLPKTWKDKAGSEEAAVLGAELFNRAFSAYLATDQNLITPDATIEAAYGARTQAVMERISRRDPTVFADPFSRQVRYWELMARLKTRDEERAKILNFKPKSQSATELRQWQIARDAAAARMNVQVLEEQVAVEWLGLAKTFETKSGQEVVAADWAKSYKYRFIVAQELAKQVGLTVNDADKSDFVSKVVIAASIKTEEKLNQTSEKFYMRTLSPDDRKFYEAQIFSTSFVENYIDLSVRSDEHLNASTSLEYPGRFQNLRRKLVDVPGGKYISRVIRGVEGFFRNEETSYAPGIWASLDRNIPIVPDLYHNFVRNLRVMPYIMTMSYLTSYYVWQIHIPYPLWALSVATGFVATSLVEFNNRLMRNFDIKPMDDVPSKLTYAFLHSNLTNPEVMLIQSIAQPVTAGFDAGITQPLRGALRACERALIGRGG